MAMRIMGLLLLLLLLSTDAWAEPADLIVKNAQVYTVDGSRRWAHAFAVGNGRFLKVGTDEQVMPLAGPDTEVLDLAGKMVLPGFQDSHVHPVAGGVETLQCDLNSAESPQQGAALIRKYGEDHPDKTWIVGGGWALPNYPEGQPNKAMLDDIIADRPVFLTSADAHTAWVNSKALELAQIDATTADPFGGQIVRSADGQPTGLLREEAIKLVAKLLPTTTDEEYDQGLAACQKLARQLGITSVFEANATESILAAYRRAEDSGTLTLRVTASQTVDPELGPEQVAKLEQLRDTYHGRLLRADSAKIFTDGVIEGHTAALLEPYLDKPGDRGLTMMEYPAMESLAVALDRAKFQLHFHAIGDRGIRQSLDSIEQAQKLNGQRDARHHIAHLQLVDEADIPRFRRLGVIANIQPLWAYRDIYIEKLTEPVLGPDRSRRLYPFRDFLESGTILAAGSDWTVSSMNPMEAIEVGLTRKSYEKPGEAWLPEQRLDLPSLLAAYTINGAYLTHREGETGSIEEGKFADFIVLDQNLFEIPSSEISNTHVLATYLEGTLVFSKGQKL
jgi:predicted amidohydrolase YtcJ